MVAALTSLSSTSPQTARATVSPSLAAGASPGTAPGAGGNDTPASVSALLRQYADANAKLTQTAKQAISDRKGVDKQKVTAALKQIQLLELFSSALGPRKTAEEAAQIAHEVADAAQDYAETGPSATATSVTTATPDTGVDIGAAATPAASSVADTEQTASAAAGADPQPDIAQATAPVLNTGDEDFFNLAKSALGLLGQIVKKATGQLSVSAAPGDHAAARRLAKSFDDAVAETNDAAGAGSASDLSVTAGAATQVTTVGIDITA